MVYGSYVALGDSLTEGKGDVHPDGSSRGFADLLSQSVRAANPEASYVNLARPSVRTTEVRSIQVAEAVPLAPDLLTVVTGVNDIIAVRLDVPAVERTFRGLLADLAAGSHGTTVVTATLPDLTEVSAVARVWRRRVARVNAVIRSAAQDSGVMLVDLDEDAPLHIDEVALDRVHPSPLGHLRLARRFAAVLALPDPEPDYLAPAARARSLRRVGRTVWAAPQFLAKRAVREQMIARQAPKHDVRRPGPRPTDSEVRAGISLSAANLKGNAAGDAT